MSPANEERRADALDDVYGTLVDTLGFHHGNRYADYGGVRIMSAFQPIYSLPHRRIVGLECLVRGVDEQQRMVSPAALFSMPQDNDRAVVNLDQLCQLVHMENFHALDLPSTWLFLNVDPRTLSEIDSHSAFLTYLLRDRNCPPDRLVIEILESTIDDEMQLEARIQRYKDLGFLIAIDDFGAGHSNFERIWRIKPDIVKLDRRMVQKAGVDPSVKSLLRGITSMLHNCKCIVLAEGVETEQEALAAMDAQVDLIQGFYFAQPFLLSESIATRQGLWQQLYNRFDELTLKNVERRRERLSPYSHRFSALTVGAQRKHQLEDVAKVMFGLDNTLRLYQLALDGSQCFSNLNSPCLKLSSADRLSVLSDANGASWKRRDYFVNAVNNPGNVQVTEPYFSISDGTLCITLSVLTTMGGREYILCCDVLYED